MKEIWFAMQNFWQHVRTTEISHADVSPSTCSAVSSSDVVYSFLLSLYSLKSNIIILVFSDPKTHTVSFLLFFLFFIFFSKKQKSRRSKFEAWISNSTSFTFQIIISFKTMSPSKLGLIKGKMNHFVINLYWWRIKILTHEWYYPNSNIF